MVWGHGNLCWGMHSVFCSVRVLGVICYFWTGPSSTANRGYLAATKLLVDACRADIHPHFSFDFRNKRSFEASLKHLINQQSDIIISYNLLVSCSSLRHSRICNQASIFADNQRASALYPAIC